MNVLFAATKRRYLLAFGLTLWLLGSVAPTGWAADQGEVEKKIYSAASICQPVKRFGGFSSSYQYPMDNGSIRNRKPASYGAQAILHLMCAPMRDNTQTTSGLRSVTVRMTDNHSQQNASCRVQRLDLWGRQKQATSWKSNASNSGIISFFRPLTFSERGNTVYMIECKIPGDDFYPNNNTPFDLHSIVVEEEK